MKQILSSLCFLLMVGSAHANESIKAFCKEDNSKAGVLDQGLYQHCLQRQAEAVTEIEYLNKEFKGQFWFEHISGPNCFEHWTKHDLVNYTMVAHCLGKEKEGNLNLRYAIDKRKFDADAIDFCMAKKIENKNAMEMADYCIQNLSNGELSKAKEEFAVLDQKMPLWREELHAMYVGSPKKQNFFSQRSMPALPDVSGISNQVAQNNDPKTAPAKSDGLFDKARNWFSSSSREPASSGCPVTKTKAKFFSTCRAALRYSAMNSSSARTEAEEREMCRCMAENFTVERGVSPPDCEFTYQLVYAFKNQDAVHLKCGD